MSINELSLEHQMNSKVMEVAVSLMKADPNYQRTPSQTFVDELARNYDMIKAELPLISNRGPREGDDEIPGGYWIISGQHRIRAAHKLGMKKVLCRVIDLTAEENPRKIEAYYRLGTNRRVGDQARDSFKAKIAMEDEEAIAIVEICTRHGVEINLSAVNNETGINATSALEIIFRRDQGAALSETLDMLQKAYGETTGINNPRVCSSNLLKAVSWFIEAHSLEANQQRLTDKLQSLTPRQLDSRAAQMQSIGGKSRWQNIYLVLLELYNDRLVESNRLQINFRGSGSVQSEGHQRKKRVSQGGQ